MTAAAVPAGGSASRGVATAGLGLLALALLSSLVAALVYARHAIAYPFSLDYGEGIVWQQMNDIVAGIGYRPIGVYPAIVYHYPPVFHLAAAGIGRLFPLDPLAGGRLVEMLATAAAALFVGLLAIVALADEGRTGVRRLCGFAAAGLFVASDPVVQWGSLMRVDMLAVAFALAGLWCAIRALDRPGWVHAAALCFVLSVFTKQIMLAAPAAAFLTLFVVRPRVAMAGLAMTLGLGAAALAALEIWTGGGFLVHVILYNVNRIDPARLLFLLQPLTQQIGALIVAIFGAGSAWRRIGATTQGAAWAKRLARLRHDPAAAALAMLLLFLLVKTAMLAAIMKSGANFNYGIEWLAAVAIFAGRGMGPVVALALGETRSAVIPRVLLAAVVILLPLQVLLMPRPSWDVPSRAARAASLAEIVHRIEASPRPVIADDMTLLLRAGQPVGWEPAIAAELAHTGHYDEAAFVRHIRAKAFGFFVTEGGPGEPWFDERYNPPVTAALLAAYPTTETIGGLTLRLPRTGIDRRGAGSR